MSGIPSIADRGQIPAPLFVRIGFVNWKRVVRLDGSTSVLARGSAIFWSGFALFGDLLAVAFGGGLRLESLSWRSRALNGLFACLARLRPLSGHSRVIAF